MVFFMDKVCDEVERLACDAEPFSTMSDKGRRGFLGHKVIVAEKPDRPLANLASLRKWH